MPRQTEPNVNNALGILLQGMFSRSRVYYENTQVIAGHPSRQPDILIAASGRSPVVVEAEYGRAPNVEEEAKSRLGLSVTVAGRPVEAAIALRYPRELRAERDLAAQLKKATLSYCVFTQERNSIINRFPESGWLDGSVEDLADLIRLVSVPQWAVDRATEILRSGIDGAARILDEAIELNPAAAQDIASRLGMIDLTQTRRMACAIMANAMVFHGRIAKMHPGINSLESACGDETVNPQRETLAAWKAILKINYWPIFAIASQIVGELPAGHAAQILRKLKTTAEDINSAGVENAHDLTGRIFQTLIADRKYLATFYTLPSSSALLARLAVAKMKGVDWSDKEAIGKLRIADFASGTGALLSAVYEQIAARHERAGGRASDLHRVMMEEVLYGCDVMPSAVHITCSTLSGMEPAEKFGKSRIYALKYGRQQDGDVMIGSLEYLRTSALWTLFNTSDPAIRVGSDGEEMPSQAIANIPDKGFDLVIMNPPFTRNVTREGATADTVAAAFAAFGASESDQRDMAKRMAGLKADTCYHGNAGMASAFAALADRKLKPGGVLALVLPLSAASGYSWQKFREMIANYYTDLTVVSIAANNNAMSFSSDTGMAECLVTARKLKLVETPSAEHRFISLDHRPSGLAEPGEIAKSVLNSGTVRQIQDGPYGGTALKVGTESVGGMMTTPTSSGDLSWSAVRLVDYSLAQTAYALSNSKLWLPAVAVVENMGIDELGTVGKLGTYHLDIIGAAPRGPFDKEGPSPTATYPSLWNHHAKNETRLICSPDSQLQVRPGMKDKAEKVRETASRAHLNSDFTFGSQALVVAFTDVKSLGGSVWPNVIFDDESYDYAFSVWGNSTLGLLSYWWQSSRQQSAKARMTIRSAESLAILDLRALTDAQLAKAKEIFDEFRDKELHPAYLADADPNRALLDRRVIRDLLGFDEDTYLGVRRLAAKWCAEPSVHGGKKRPAWAKFVT